MSCSRVLGVDVARASISSQAWLSEEAEYYDLHVHHDKTVRCVSYSFLHKVPPLCTPSV